jgi:hypothetical protein
MDKCFRLELVGPPATSDKVIHISGIRSHAPTPGGSVAAPWPRQDAWQRRLNAAVNAEKEGKS